MRFVCGPCKEGQHDACKGSKSKTWCDCQHKPVVSK